MHQRAGHRLPIFVQYAGARRALFKLLKDCTMYATITCSIVHATSYALTVNSSQLKQEDRVSTGLRLSDYATTPLYNIKAVVQATGISPSTLRAWERRYRVARPQRSESGYRLYSERDITVIRWLRAQVDAGMSISQAVAWFQKIVEEATGLEHAVLPAASGNTTATLHDLLSPSLGQHRARVRDFESLQRDLLAALLTFDENDAEIVVAEAFAMYPVEQVGEHLFMPVLVELGERWHRGELSVTGEHYASNYLIQRLGTLLRSIPNGVGGPLIWVGCAPGELHEVGALLLGIYLRRSGYRVHYLGQNLPVDDFTAEVKRQQPAVILFSASTRDSAQELAKVTTQLSQNGASTTLVGYGGQIFLRHPELRSAIPGVYMGASAQEAVEQIDALLQNRGRSELRGRYHPPG